MRGPATLEERLTAYRRTIENAPRPTEHRKVGGVNRFLGDIIDRCLATQPARRYPNVQALLSDLDDWHRRKARRPILILGTAIPLVLLGLMAFFGWKVFDTSMTRQVQGLTKRTNELHELAATYAGPAVAAKIHTRWAVLHSAAEELGSGGDSQAESMPKPPGKKVAEAKTSNQETGKSAAPAKASPPTGKGDKLSPVAKKNADALAFVAKASEGFLQTSLADPKRAGRAKSDLSLLGKAVDHAKEQIAAAFQTDPDSAEKEAKIESILNTGDGFGKVLAYADGLPEGRREEAQHVILRWKALQDWIKQLRTQFQNQGLPSTSWFITNDRGDQIARDPLDLETLFKKYAHRDYFHGQRRDLDEQEAATATPIKKPHLSHVFLSKATHQPMVAFTVPIRTKVKNEATGEEETVVAGVLGMAVEFGEFSELLVEFGGDVESQNDEQRKEKAIITALIDAREDFVGKRGGLLEHPLLRRLREKNLAVDQRYYVNDEIRHEVRLLTQPEDGAGPFESAAQRQEDIRQL